MSRTLALAEEATFRSQKSRLIICTLDVNSFSKLFLKTLFTSYSPAHAQGNLDRVRCQVLMINMVADNMVPIELGDARKVAERLKNATYLEVNEEAKYGHGARGRTVTVCGVRNCGSG
jgi:homoserine acetyltransferase